MSSGQPSQAPQDNSASASADAAWVSRLRGRLVVFDGPDGSGKSTQCRRFGDWVEDAGMTVCRVREPGGTAIGEQLREVLLDPGNEAMDLRCEMLLYMASRAQLVRERIGPSLADQQLVLADRFISSTLAYQGAAGGLDPQDIVSIGRFALGDVWPDLVVIFDVDEETASARMLGRATNKYKKQLEPTLFSDRIEQRSVEYHRTVRRGYREQASLDPQRYLVIDARADEEAVWQTLLHELDLKTRDWHPHTMPSDA